MRLVATRVLGAAVCALALACPAQDLPVGKRAPAPGEGLFDPPQGLRIDADDNRWPTHDTNPSVLKPSP